MSSILKLTKEITKEVTKEIATEELIKDPILDPLLEEPILETSTQQRKDPEECISPPVDKKLEENYKSYLQTYYYWSLLEGKPFSLRKHRKKIKEIYSDSKSRKFGKSAL